MESGVQQMVNESTPINILILEDDAIMMSFLEDIISTSDKECNISTAKLGIAAIDLIKNSKFDIAFIDLWLPDMNGLDVLACIRDFSPQTERHVISSQNDNSYVDRAKALGVKSYIVKPFSDEQILEIINNFKTDAIETVSQ